VTYGQATGKKSWNGPGSLIGLSHLALRGEGKHKAEKPLDQCLDLVSWFSNPGELVFDPFAGRGTFGLACRILGRSYLGCEVNPEEHAKASARLASSLSDRDRERLKRYCEGADNEDVSQSEGPAQARRDRRLADRDLARSFQ
jgi:DNA modification methylase